MDLSSINSILFFTVTRPYGVPLNRVYLGVHILESIIHIHAVAVLACSYMLVATLIVVYLSISPSAGFCGRFLPCLILLWGTLRLLSPPILAQQR
jgi:hypothetical protein